MSHFPCFLEQMSPDLCVTGSVCHRICVSPDLCVTGSVCHQISVSSDSCVTGFVCHWIRVSSDSCHWIRRFHNQLNPMCVSGFVFSPKQLDPIRFYLCHRIWPIPTQLDPPRLQLDRQRLPHLCECAASPLRRMPSADARAVRNLLLEARRPHGGGRHLTTSRR